MKFEAGYTTIIDFEFLRKQLIIFDLANSWPLPNGWNRISFFWHLRQPWGQNSLINHWLKCFKSLSDHKSDNELKHLIQWLVMEYWYEEMMPISCYHLSKDRINRKIKIPVTQKLQSPWKSPLALVIRSVLGMSKLWATGISISQFNHWMV